jgi:hypothetical protein
VDGSDTCNILLLNFQEEIEVCCEMSQFFIPFVVDELYVFYLFVFCLKT